MEEYGYSKEPEWIAHPHTVREMKALPRDRMPQNKADISGSAAKAAKHKVKNYAGKDTVSKTALVLDWILDKGILVVCLLLLLMCFYAGYDTYMIFYHAQDDSILKYKPTHDIETARYVLGEDCAAWLTIDGTNIDYPIMQGRDNSKYLNTDPYGNTSLSGSIFLDSANSPDFSDSYNLVYGHHMDHGAMFGALDDFLDRKYLDSHKTGTLICESGTYEVAIFAAAKTEAAAKPVFTPGNDGIMDWLKENADIYEEPVNKHIIALTTCRDASTARTAVFGCLNLVRGAKDLQEIQDEKVQKEVDAWVAAENNAAQIFSERRTLNE